MKIEIVDIEEKKRQQREINGGSIESELQATKWSYFLNRYM